MLNSRIRKQLLCLAVAALAVCPGRVAQAQGDATSSDGVWQRMDQRAQTRSRSAARIHPTRFKTYALDKNLLNGLLIQAPLEFTKQGNTRKLELSIPMPDGTFSRFAVVESPVMAPELAAKFPTIKTFVGQGIDDPAATIRLDVTPLGFHGQVLSPRGAFYIDPYLVNDTETYASYYKKDYPNDGKPFSCGVLPRGDAVSSGALLSAPAATAAARGVRGPSVGDSLKKYRIAVAAQGEYTSFFGGTVTGALAAIVTTINRVTGIYETELAIRLELVADNDQVIYTDAGSDPYLVNDSTGAILETNQYVLDTVIGSANYDIGHVFNTGGGGLAGLGVVCDINYKAEGSTGRSSPVGDAFDVDFVAHEIGHQFGGDHTFNGVNGACSPGSRNPGTAYEPGSGSSIQAYAGICGADNLQANSDPFMHFASFTQIMAYVTTGTGASCPTNLVTGNTIPTVAGGSDHGIPVQTPFELTGVGDDGDGDTLTYSWEQADLGSGQALTASDNGSSPLFRSFPPSTSPTRTFPQKLDILNNTNSNSEKLPTMARTMDFRVTVRDNKAGGGGVNSDDVALTVDSSAGPFLVTAPNTVITWAGTETVTWNIANTTNATVNATHVDIFLSTNGGFDFDIVLVTNTPNDGSEVVLLPGVGTSSARIKVKGNNNVFFDVSDTNFTIQAGVSFVASGGPLIDDSMGNGNTNTYADPGESNLELRVAIENNGSSGSTGVSGTLTSLTATATILSDTSTYPDVGPGSVRTNDTGYTLSIDGAHPCGDPVVLQLKVESDQVTNTLAINLDTGVVGASVTSSYDTVTAIPDNGPALDLAFVVPVTGTIADVNFKFDGSVCTATEDATTVGLAHTWVGDLQVTLISPSNTQVLMMDRPGGGSFGSSGNNFCQTLLDDDAAAPSIQGIDSGGLDQPHTGTWAPANPLSAFDGEQAQGSWTLRLLDNEAFDEGTVRSFSIIISTLSCEDPASGEVVMNTITTVVNGAGAISPLGNVDVASGSDTNFVISAQRYYYIEKIETNGAPTSDPVGPGVTNYVYVWSNVIDSGMIEASFAENLATNQTPEWWLASFGLTNTDFDSAALADQDLDGVPSWKEFIARTVPTNESSFFRATEITTGAGTALKWTSESNRTYTVECSTNGPKGTFAIVTNVAATPPVNTLVVTNQAGTVVIYRIQISSP